MDLETLIFIALGFIGAIAAMIGQYYHFKQEDQTNRFK